MAMARVLSARLQADKVLLERGAFDELQNWFAERVLFILDGTGKLRGEDTRSFFVDDAEQLLAIETHVVYTVPLSLEYEGHLAGKLDADLVLPMIKLDDALRSRREEELPASERLGAVRELAIGSSRLAFGLLRKGDALSAVKLLRQAHAAAVTLQIPEAKAIEDALHGIASPQVATRARKETSTSGWSPLCGACLQCGAEQILRHDRLHSSAPFFSGDNPRRPRVQCTALVLLAAAALMCNCVHAQALGCNGDLAQIGDSKASVLLKCGAPFFTESFCKPADQMLLPATPPGTTTVNIVPCALVDEWTCNPGPGQFLPSMRFGAGVMTGIRYGDRVN